MYAWYKPCYIRGILMDGNINIYFEKLETIIWLNIIWYLKIYFKIKIVIK